MDSYTGSDHQILTDWVVEPACGNIKSYNSIDNLVSFIFNLRFCNAWMKLREVLAVRICPSPMDLWAERCVLRGLSAHNVKIIRKPTGEAVGVTQTDFIISETMKLKMSLVHICRRTEYEVLKRDLPRLWKNLYH